MCQYSSDEGKMTDWHFVHLGAMAARGLGAIVVEASFVPLPFPYLAPPPRRSPSSLPI
jgi:2,4-dienoyl-CoA reductase-like NADH-dependent reductase (Old Yellow Enzyme family)